jgi:pilus assembly protein CpaC
MNIKSQALITFSVLMSLALFTYVTAGAADSSNATQVSDNTTTPATGTGTVVNSGTSNPSSLTNPVDNDDQVKTGAKRYGSSRLTNDRSEISADKRQLLLSKGENKPVDIDFDIPNVNGIVVGNPKVLTYDLVKIGDKRQIMFKPLDKGDSNVTVRDGTGEIRVIFQVHIADSDLLRLAGELRELLRDVEGIEIHVVGSKVVIDGDVITPADFGRVSTVLSDGGYGASVLNLVQLSNKALVALAKRIQDDIRVFASNVTARVVNGVIFLEGTVDNIDQSRRAMQIADTYLPAPRPNSLIENVRDVQLRQRSPVLNFMVVNAPPPKKQEKLVRVTFHFVELSKDYDKLFAFQWSPGFTADPSITVGTGNTGAVAAQGTSFTGTLSSLFPKLQTAQEAGYARVLRTGTIVVRSGQPAQISEATSLPFSTAGQNGQINAGDQQIKVEFGVTPQILGQSEDISMDVKSNVMSIVGREPAAGTRAVTDENHIETKIYVKSSESAAIGGMTFTDAGTDFNKDAPTNNLNTPEDPLFTLLHSKEYRKKKSQFVVFVTPQIVENASEGTDDLKKNFRVKVK